MVAKAWYPYSSSPETARCRCHARRRCCTEDAAPRAAPSPSARSMRGTVSGLCPAEWSSHSRLSDCITRKFDYFVGNTSRCYICNFDIVRIG